MYLMNIAQSVYSPVDGHWSCFLLFFSFHIKLWSALKIFCLLSGHFCEVTAIYSIDREAKWLPHKLHIFKFTEDIYFYLKNESISLLPKSMNGRCCKSVLRVGVVKNTKATKWKIFKHCKIEVQYWSNDSAVKNVYCSSRGPKFS